MAMAVVFAMIASFVLSRTLVPTMANFLLRDHAGPTPWRSWRATIRRQPDTEGRRAIRW